MQSYNIGVRIETIVRTEADPGDIAFDLRKVLDKAAQEVAGKGSTGNIESFITHMDADPFEATYLHEREKAHRAGVWSVGNVANLKNVHDRRPSGADPQTWYAAVIALLSRSNLKELLDIPADFWLEVHETYRSMVEAGSGIESGSR